MAVFKVTTNKAVVTEYLVTAADSESAQVSFLASPPAGTVVSSVETIADILQDDSSYVSPPETPVVVSEDTV